MLGKDLDAHHHFFFNRLGNIQFVHLVLIQDRQDSGGQGALAIHETFTAGIVRR